MRYHFVPKSQCQRAFFRTARPAVEIDSEDIVTFETSDDAYLRLSRGESPDEIPDEDYNVVTGPVAVNGAEPGDSLQIDIISIQIHRAWSVWIPGYGPLGHLTDSLKVRQLPVTGGRVIVSDRIQVPLSPMIGCLGVAPATGAASTLEPAYPFGGNLDLCELSAGATVLLPVQTSGGWLALGDLHAAMGAGEPAHISLEAAGEAIVRVSVMKHRSLDGPVIRYSNRTSYVTVLNEEGTLEQAVQVATERAYEALLTDFRMTSDEAYTYLSARVSLRFGGPASPIVIAEIPHPH